MNGKRHILRRLRIREVSGVDFPAQEPALVSLIKMKDTDDKPEPEVPADDKPTPPVDAAVAPEDKDKETNMDELEKAKARIKELEAQLSKAQTLSTLNDAERGYAKALGEDAASAFLAKGSAARADELKGAVEYTATDGTVYYKFDDQRLVKMAKGRDHDHARSTELIEKAQNSEFAKRVTTEFRHLPVDETAGVALLKAVATIADDKVREAVEKALKAHDGQNAGAHREAGVNPGDPIVKSAQVQLDEAVVKFATEQKMDPEKDLAKATRAFLQTTEGRKLYKATQPKITPAPTN